MIKKFIIGVIAAIGISAHAELNTVDASIALTPSPAQAQAISFIQGADQAGGLSFAAYPGFAPDLQVNGVSKSWGFGVAALYPLSKYAFTGVRIDYMGDAFFAPSVDVGFKADIQLFGHTVTPFAIGGAIAPLQGAGDKTKEVGAIVGSGFTSVIWKSADGKKMVNLFYAVEHWTLFNGVVHRPGAAFSVKF
jgi:hypothetical protein